MMKSYDQITIYHPVLDIVMKNIKHRFKRFKYFKLSKKHIDNWKPTSVFN